MHVLIIGCGLSGLSLYLHLRKLLPPAPATKITILERHASTKSLARDTTPSTFAGALGLAPNGFRILRKLDPDLAARVEARGVMVQDFEFRTSGDRSLGLWPAVDSSGRQKGDGTIMITRKGLWDVLRAEVGEGVIREGEKVVSVDVDGKVKLEGGEVLWGDLVVGADGAQSAARQAVIAEGEEGREVEFQNLMNVGGGLPFSYLELPNSRASVRMIFGRTGFIGLTPVCNSTGVVGQAAWWSTYPDDLSPDMRKTTNQPSDPALPSLLAHRHGNWTDPTVQRIILDLNNDQSDAEIRKASLDLHTPTWVLPKLPRWSKGRIALTGDAAHALPSTSGQGVSQAFEDASVLSLLLAIAIRWPSQSSGSLNDDAISWVTKSYERLRKPRVGRILDGALQMQTMKKKMGWLEEMIMMVLLWVLIKVGGGKQEDWKFGHDVEDAVQELVEGTAS